MHIQVVIRVCTVTGIQLVVLVVTGRHKLNMFRGRAGKGPLACISSCFQKFHDVAE